MARQPRLVLGGESYRRIPRAEGLRPAAVLERQSFKKSGLRKEGSFKAAEMRYTSVKEVRKTELARWLKDARAIQWDYKNIVKRKGVLVRRKPV